MKNYLSKSLSLVLVSQLTLGQQAMAEAAKKWEFSAPVPYNQPTSEYAKQNINIQATSTGVIPETKSKIPLTNSGYTYSQGETGSTAAIEFTLHPINKEGKSYNSDNQDYKMNKPQFVVGDAKVTGTTIQDPNYISKLRDSFLQDKKNYAQNLQNQKEMMRSFGATAEWQKTIWGSQLRRFPTETLMFFVAIGVVNTANLLADYSNNPLLMEQHLQTLTDPIGNLSFLAFMVANGYAHHFLDRPALTTRYLKKDIAQIFQSSAIQAKLKGVPESVFLSEAAKYTDGKALNAMKLAYAHMIPYLSMTVGSMASHFVGDFFHTMQACVQSFSPQNKQAKPTKQLSPLGSISQDPCDVAWREWTIEKKFNTYAPAIASMMLSQAMATGVSIVSKEGLKIGVFESATSTATKQAFNFRLLGFDLLTNMAPTGAAMRGIRLVGHVTNLALFTALDQMIHHWVEDIVLNTNYGNYSFMPRTDAFPRKAEILFDILQSESKNKYAKISDVCRKDIQDYDCQTGDIEGYLHNFTETMTKWKDFNKTKPMMAHQNWLQNVNNFQATEVATQAFYKEWMLDIQNAEYYRKNPIKDVVKIDKQLSDAEKMKALMNAVNEGMEKGTLSMKDLRDVPPMANYIKYPLFGIDPAQGIKEIDYSKWKNNYVEDPRKIEAAQLAHVKQVAAEFKDYLSRKDLNSSKYKNDAETLKNVMENLDSADLNKVGYAINLMRYYREANSGASEQTQAIFTDFLNRLGNPAPLMFQGQGFSFGIEGHTGFKDILKSMVLPSYFRDLKLSSNIRFSKKSDYLYYHMLCGPSATSEDVTMITKKYYEIFGVNTYIPKGLQTLFIPPAIVNPEMKADICDKALGFKNSNELYSMKIVNSSTDEQYKGIFAAIYKNLAPEIKTIVDSDPTFGEAMGEDNFPQFTSWWEKNIEGKVIKKLEDFKEDYNEIAVDLLNAQLKQDSTLNNGIVKNSIVGSNMQEARIYSLIAAHVASTVLSANDLKEHLDSSVSGTATKVKYKQDIFTAQLSPYQQDFNALNTGGSTKVFKFQSSMEQMLRLYYETIKSFKVEKVKNSHGNEVEVVNTNLDEVKTEEVSKQIDALTAQSSEELFKLAQKMESNPKAVSVLTYIKDQIERLSKELTMTLDMINLMTQKVTEKTNKKVSKEIQEARKNRMLREQESSKKHCKQRNAITGASGDCSP